MEYLKNNICKFNPLFKFDPKNKKNIISLSFFKLYGGGYKDFKIYIDGFLKLHKDVIEEKEYNFTIRLFIDNSIYNDKELMKLIEDLERVEIIVYSCDNYLEPKDLNHHKGTFGMFVRFFPLFDFENNDADIVMISDMDDDGIFKKNMEVLKKVDKKELKELYLFNISVLGKNIKHNFDFLYKERVTGYFISPKLIGLKRINYKIIVDYLNNIDLYYNKAIKVYEYKLTSKSGKDKWLNGKGKFIYGIDEYFLNSELMYYLINNNLPYGIYIKYDISMFIYYFLVNYSFKKDKIKLLEYIIEFILKKLEIKYDKNSGIKNKYNFIDKILYSEEDNKLREELFFNLYKSFLYNYANTKYEFIFSKNLYKLIKLYDLFGIYKCEFIIYYNKDLTYSIHFIEKNIFPKDKLKELEDFSKKYAKIFSK
jgi:hypothetical protein